MLTLPIKKKWFDMILSGEKQEEYREIKPYWTTRFRKDFGSSESDFNKYLESGILDFEVQFRNGYSSNSPRVNANIHLVRGTGKEEWGAEPGKEYYVLQIMQLWGGNVW